MKKCLHVLEVSGFDLENHLESIEDNNGNSVLFTQGQIKQMRTKHSVRAMKNSLTFKIFTVKQYVEKLNEVKKIQ